MRISIRGRILPNSIELVLQDLFVRKLKRPAQSYLSGVNLYFHVREHGETLLPHDILGRPIDALTYYASATGVRCDDVPGHLTFVRTTDELVLRKASAFLCLLDCNPSFLCNVLDTSLDTFNLETAHFNASALRPEAISRAQAIGEIADACRTKFFSRPDIFDWFAQPSNAPSHPGVSRKDLLAIRGMAGILHLHSELDELTETGSEGHRHKQGESG